MLRTMRHLLLFFLLFVSSCSKERAALYHFNQVNDLIKKIESLQNEYAQKMEEAINSRKMSGNIPEAELVRQELVRKVEIYIRKIKKVHSLQNDNSFRDAAATYFEGTREIINNESKQIIALRTSHIESQQQNDSINLLLGAIQNKKSNYISEFFKVREEFAKKYQLVILSKEQNQFP